MIENKRPLKVFLCHASTDKPKVRELYRYLKKRGIQPWFDEEDLVGGQDWQVEIPKALATSDAIIICLTKNSVDKEGYIQKEIKFALDKALEMPEGRIFLIPVKFEECEVPFTLSRYQWVDLTVESGYAKMMKALKFRASQLERSTVEVSKKDVEDGNLVREKAEKEAAEKARLEAEDQARQKAAKEKAEREANERAKRERIKKELREKQAREAGEKNKYETDKKEDKPVNVKPKAGGQIVYWFGGFAILILGVVLFASLNKPSESIEPTPENTPSQIIATSTQVIDSTPNIALTSTPSSTTEDSHTNRDCVYNVMAGETLYGIAEKFGIGGENWKSLSCAPDDLAGCDMSQPQNIMVGWRLIVPNVKEGLCNLYGEPLTDSKNTSLSTEVTDSKGVSMVLISVGDFEPFYMDKFEVTNESYKKCVTSGECLLPTNLIYYNQQSYVNHPVVYVNKDMASNYCKWRETRLPTETEWEQAVKGNSGDDRDFPWGNERDCKYANFGYGISSGEGSQAITCKDGTTPVGSYELGKSEFNIYDLIGNVMEWTDSRIGGASGGSWARYEIYPMFVNSPETTVNDLGFRCAKDATP